MEEQEDAVTEGILDSGAFLSRHSELTKTLRADIWRLRTSEEFHK